MVSGIGQLMLRQLRRPPADRVEHLRAPPIVQPIPFPASVAIHGHAANLAKLAATALDLGTAHEGFSAHSAASIAVHTHTDATQRIDIVVEAQKDYLRQASLRRGVSDTGHFTGQASTEPLPATQSLLVCLEYAVPIRPGNPAEGSIMVSPLSWTASRAAD